MLTKLCFIPIVGLQDVFRHPQTHHESPGRVWLWRQRALGHVNAAPLVAGAVLQVSHQREPCVQRRDEEVL